MAWPRCGRRNVLYGLEERRVIGHDRAGSARGCGPDRGVVRLTCFADRSMAACRSFSCSRHQSMHSETEPSRRPSRVLALLKAPEWALGAGILAVLAVIYLLDRDGAFYQSYSLQTLLAYGRPFWRAGRRRGGGDHRRRDRPFDRRRGLARVGRQRQAADRVAARFIVSRRRRPA